MKGVAKYPNTGLVFFPRARLRYSKLRNYIHALFAHYLPAFVLDLVISLMGDKPMLMDIQSRYFKGMQYTSFFTCREWLFDKRNTDDLSSRLSPDDKEKFDFETKHIDWPSYMETCVLGVRRFYHKEPDKNLHVARAIHWLTRNLKKE
ncbi:unnamed protein product [Nesidiocoris tenuis]|uniref:Fatty acyl-CoA reductase C-terminal domain-containing protein n=1 Tax=Nesidiocoris tenuis TaxID=355587 RepID=A0A6H5G4H5_9HEMI|nr:unnamed protein product [Nesidiocoris tenuis]